MNWMQGVVGATRSGVRNPDHSSQKMKNGQPERLRLISSVRCTFVRRSRDLDWLYELLVAMNEAG